MNILTRLTLMAVAALMSVGFVQTAWSSSFSVAPVRVLLGEQHRTERLAVKNESDRPLTLLLKVYSWSQAKDGLDHYDETSDLIVFPRVLTLNAEEERFIRVGISSPGPVEKPFRIYLEEQPNSGEQALAGNSGRILMRVGIPIFAQPRKPEPALKIKAPSFANRLLHFTLANEGNSFAVAEQITVSGLDGSGSEVFVRKLGGFYSLAGSQRVFEVEIPKDKCRPVKRVSIIIKNNGKELQNIVNIPSGACER